MTELETAIVLAFKNNIALSTAAPGGIHNVRVKTKIYPHIVFELPAGLKTNTFSHENEEMMVQFKIYTRPDNSSSASLNDLFDKLKAVYDDNQLTVSNHTTVFMRRTVSNKTQDEIDEKVWIYLVLYKIKLEKN